MNHEYDIPGFSRYCVLIRPFRIVSSHRSQPLRGFAEPGKNHRRYELRGDDRRPHHLSAIYIAALAFHGLPPRGYIAYHTGGDYTPKTVCWLPEREAKSLQNGKLSLNERFDLVEQFYDPNGMLMKDVVADLAQRLGIHERSVYRYVRRMTNKKRQA
jgi:hypothetical protein